MNNETTATVERRDRVAIIHVVGDVTTFAEEAIQQAYQDATVVGTRAIILDFRAADYINSAGIAILIGIVTQARRAGLRISVTGLSSHFQKIFSMVGLTQYAGMYPTLEDALANCAETPKTWPNPL